MFQALKGLRGPTTMAVAALVAATGLSGCEPDVSAWIAGDSSGPSSAPTDPSIDGPGVVLANEPATFAIDGLGVGSGDCPGVLNWHFENRADTGDPTVRTPNVRTTSDGRCVTDRESVVHSFPPGESGTERKVLIAAEVSNVLEDKVVFTRVTVTTPGPVGPLASFFAAVEPLVAGRTARFDAGLSSDDNGKITGYAWDFGNGQTDVGAVTIAPVQFTEGPHAVTLTVTDDHGLTNTKTIQYQVQPSNFQIYAGFSISPPTANPGEDITVTPSPHPQSP